MRAAAAAAARMSFCVPRRLRPSHPSATAHNSPRIHEDEAEEFWAKCREFGLAKALFADESRRRQIPTPSGSTRLLDEVDDSLVLAAELGF